MRVRGLGSKTLPLAAIAAAAAVAGCTWVKPTPAGEGVHIGTMSEVASCRKLGATHAKTSTKVAFFARSEKKINEELDTLARNEAGEMRGNTIVPQGPASTEGRRSFDVYSCSER
jgi:hypothetical protein